MLKTKAAITRMIKALSQTGLVDIRSGFAQPKGEFAIMHNSNAIDDTTDLHMPLPPCVDGNLDNQKFEMAVYARFMRHLRYSGRKRETVRVLEAIRFVADLMDHSDAHIAKVLTDLGMRGPRAAYPQAFLDFADHAMACSAWQLGAADSQLKELHDYWAGSERKRREIQAEQPDNCGWARFITAR